MDKHRRIRVWTHSDGTAIEVLRSVDKPYPNHYVERRYHPITEVTATRLTRLLDQRKASSIAVHTWGFYGVWFIP